MGCLHLLTHALVNQLICYAAAGLSYEHETTWFCGTTKSKLNFNDFKVRGKRGVVAGGRSLMVYIGQQSFAPTAHHPLSLNENTPQGEFVRFLISY